MTKLAMLLALAACGGKQADKPAPECGPVISGAIDRMLDDARTNAKLPPDAVARVVAIAPKLKDAITKVCTDDHWLAPALDCLATAKSQHDINDCEHKLTTEQKTHADAARTAVMSALGKEPATGAPAVPTQP